MSSGEPQLVPESELSLQQKQALIGVRDLLVRLSRPELSPRVPLGIRREARALLRHYPIRRADKRTPPA